MKYRIKKIRREQGLTQAALVEAANISQPYLSQLENGSGGRAPSMETLVAIADALGVRPSSLLDDSQPVAIVGKVGAGARVPLASAEDYGGLYQVASPSELPAGAAGVEIHGDSMLPAYRDGDLLFFRRSVYGVPTEAVGAVCICEDTDENAWVKFVKHGSEPGLFHLMSLNPLAENLFDTRLRWAAPVLLHWPKPLVEPI